MIVDSSALVCVAWGEPEAAAMHEALLEAEQPRMSAASYLECGIVFDGRGDPRMTRLLDRLVDAFGIEVVAVSPEQARIARAAYRDFGRGSGHRARLNFGDCFSYALAVDADEPLLFKGEDFVHTDVRPALRGG